MTNVRGCQFEIGASEGIRTLDIHLGKVTLYQAELRSLPFKGARIKGIPLDCKPCFLATAYSPAHSFKIVNHDPLGHALEHFLDKLHMERMNLVFVLRLLVGEDTV